MFGVFTDKFKFDRKLYAQRRIDAFAIVNDIRAVIFESCILRIVNLTKHIYAVILKRLFLQKLRYIV